MIKKTKISQMDYILYMLLLLILLAPLFRGLFFDNELALAHMYTAVVAGLYFWTKGDQIKFSKNITDYAGAGLILAYGLSFFVAWNTRDGIGEVFKTLNYFLVFWLIAKTAVNFENRRKVMWILYSSGLIVSFIGLGCAFGTFTYEGAFVDGLISSTLQYHNAGAIFMVAAGIIGLYLAITVKSLNVKMFLGAGNYIIFTAAIGAGSRGATLVAPIALLLQLIGLFREDKKKYFSAVMTVLISFIITVKYVLNFNDMESPALWGTLIAGMAIAAGIQYGIDKINFTGIKIKKSWLAAGILVVVAALGGLFIVKGGAILPERIVSRVENISLKENNILERFYFYSDAMKMIQDEPVLGYGGGGWKAAYQKYQSYLYFSSEVHDHPLQVWIEAGLLGFAFYLLLWIGTVRSIGRIMKKTKNATDSDDRKLAWSAFAAAIALCLHSLIDFTLSLGALMIFLWTLLGLIRAVDEQVFKNENNFFKIAISRNYRKYAGTAFMVLFFAAGTCFWLASRAGEEAYDAYAQGNFEMAIEKLDWATTLDPFNGDMFSNKAVIYSDLLSTNPDIQYKVNMLIAARESAERRRGDYGANMGLAHFLLNAGDYDQAILTAEEALAHSPLLPVAYEETANVYNNAAQGYLQQDDITKARQVREKTLLLPERMKNLWNGLSEDEKRLSKDIPLDKVSAGLQKQLDTARKMFE